MYWILFVPRRFKTGSKLYKECMSSLALLPPRKSSCSFWKPISPWTLYPKRQKFHQLLYMLCFTSSFNVCSQFVSIAWCLLSAKILLYTQKCKWSFPGYSFILVEDKPHAQLFLIRGLEEETRIPPQFHLRICNGNHLMTDIDPFPCL